ncbi:hypothetical protein NLM31_26465 [Bradyrhizobium sp. CCGUVB4N]|uniref:hypothetical protein n=1 Tax=Bradyrhizobium sp. CCGUVB4N TaxID=2949631 RepID=UPI0020B2D168|nr:hypothetical protein [Bradyrhizobium sp. CCGUVB4N]MCP3383917.1 hypothetical protein [Bradyrhizobium sp. CCGUVB4N]
MKPDELTELFRRLGARNPADWARSQLDEDLPQLARFLFLREAWKLVVADDGAGWIRDRINDVSSNPGGEIGPALQRLLSAGAAESDLTAVVRAMQWRLLFGLCRLLDDPGSLEEEARGVAWRLFQIDEDERPTVVMGGLYESILEMDPTGREMRPV